MAVPGLLCEGRPAAVHGLAWAGAAHHVPGVGYKVVAEAPQTLIAAQLRGRRLVRGDGVRWRARVAGRILLLDNEVRRNFVVDGSN